MRRRVGRWRSGLGRAQFGQRLRQVVQERLRKPLHVLAQPAHLRIRLGLLLAVTGEFGLVQQFALQLDNGQSQRAAQGLRALRMHGGQQAAATRRHRGVGNRAGEGVRQGRSGRGHPCRARFEA